MELPVFQFVPTALVLSLGATESKAEEKKKKKKKKRRRKQANKQTNHCTVLGDLTALLYTCTVTTFLLAVVEIGRLI